MKKFIQFICLALMCIPIISCTNNQSEGIITKENQQKDEMCPINWSIIEIFNDSMQIMRDSIIYYQSINDTFSLTRNLLEWERLYGNYLYNVFRELNLRFHQDSVYQSAYIFIKGSPGNFWSYAHGMQGANVQSAVEITDYLLWRSEQEVKLSDELEFNN